MANILDELTIGNLAIIVVDAVPSAGGGTASAIGSVALYNNSGTGEMYLKTASSATSWNKVTTS